jgi:hypothetical protein
MSYREVTKRKRGQRSSSSSPDSVQKACSSQCYEVIAHIAATVLHEFHKNGQQSIRALLDGLFSFLGRPWFDKVWLHFIRILQEQHEQTMLHYISDIRKHLERADCLDLIKLVSPGVARDALETAVDQGGNSTEIMDSPKDPAQPEDSVDTAQQHRRQVPKSKKSDKAVQAKRRMEMILSDMRVANRDGSIGQRVLKYGAFLRASMEAQEFQMSPIEAITCFRGEHCLVLLMAYDRLGGDQHLELLESALLVSNDFATYWCILTKDPKDDLVNAREILDLDKNSTGAFLAQSTKDFLKSFDKTLFNKDDVDTAFLQSFSRLIKRSGTNKVTLREMDLSRLCGISK